MNLSREQLISQLKSHGLDKIENLSTEDLQKLFKNTTINWTNNLIAYNSSTKIIPSVDIKPLEREIKEISEIFELYDFFGEILPKYPYSQIKEVLLNSIRSSLYERAEIVLEVKYMQYQEIIIEQIESKISFMPEEERYSFIYFVQENRDNVELLKKILAKLSDAKIATSIRQITNAKKHIISQFMPQDMEHNYKHFYNFSNDKQELIRQLKEISASYTNEQLNRMTKGDIKDILDSIKQKEEDDKKDKEDFEKYSILIQQSLYAENNDVFNTLIMQVLEDVSPECLVELKSYLKGKDPLFENKFNAAQAEWRKVRGML